MCGKFTAQMTWGEYVALAGVGSDGGGRGADPMDTSKMLGTFTPMRWGWYDPSAANPLRSFKHLYARA